MEPIFSNACSQTKENLLEMIKATVPAWYKLYCRIFAVLFVVMAAVLVFIEQYLFAVIFLVLAAAILAVYNRKISSRSSENMAEKF